MSRDVNKHFPYCQRRGFVAAGVQEVLSPAGTPGSSRKGLQTDLTSLSSHAHCFSDHCLAMSDLLQLHPNSELAKIWWGRKYWVYLTHGRRYPYQRKKCRTLFQCSVCALLFPSYLTNFRAFPRWFLNGLQHSAVQLFWEISSLWDNF